jgi:DNA-binding SARP family transcriptional activator
VEAQIALLGPPSVTRGGEPVTFDTRKAIALLAYLGLTGRPHSRDALCELFWPDQDPERARSALRRTLSTLRGGVGAEAVATPGDTVVLEEGLALDVWRFRVLSGAEATVTDLEAAAALFRGRLLEGFGLRDSPDFDTWLMAADDALTRELGGVLARLVAGLTEAGEHLRALEHARRWLALDPLHEPAHRALIRLYALTGDRAAALDQYRDCVRTLSAELGVAPVEETAQLYAAVSEGTLAAPDAKPAAPARRTPPGELPLIGREAELVALRAARDAVGPEGHLVLIEGEAGIGKTRLAAELTAAGGRVLAARCHEEESALPYAAVVELLRQAAAQDITAVAPQRRADAALLQPELSAPDLPPPLTPDAPGAQARLLDAVTAVLVAAADVVVVDDVHAADAATVDLLAYLGRRLRDRPLLLALSWRSEAVPPGHPLRGLARGGAVTTLRPRRLSEAEVAGLAAGDADLAGRLWLESEGLPLFVAEFLAAGGEALAGARSLLEARLAGADDVTRQVVGAAGVLGRGFDSDTLRGTSGRGEDEVAGALEDLVMRGILREHAAAYEFSHGKLRDLVYSDVGLARRRLLHRRAAATGGEAAVVAEHLRRAGDDAGAAERFAAAAEHAASLLAHAEAASHLEAALALGHPEPAALHERMGDLRTLMGEYPAALAAYETAAALAPSAALEHKLGSVHLRRGEWAAAQARLEAALDDSPLRARALADLALARHRAGDPEAAALAREAVAAASDPLARAQAHNLLGMLTGDVAELERSLALAEELGDRSAQAAALNNLALAADDPDRAIALTERALALCGDGADRHREAALLNNLADLHHAAGREAEALDHLRRAVTIFTEVGADEATRLPGIWQLVSW